MGVEWESISNYPGVGFTAQTFAVPKECNRPNERRQSPKQTPCPPLANLCKWALCRRTGREPSRTRSAGFGRSADVAFSARFDPESLEHSRSFANRLADKSAHPRVWTLA